MSIGLTDQSSCTANNAGSGAAVGAAAVGSGRARLRCFGARNRVAFADLGRHWHQARGSGRARRGQQRAAPLHLPVPVRRSQQAHRPDRRARRSWRAHRLGNGWHPRGPPNAGRSAVGLARGRSGASSSLSGGAARVTGGCSATTAAGGLSCAGAGGAAATGAWATTTGAAGGAGGTGAATGASGATGSGRAPRARSLMPGATPAQAAGYMSRTRSRIFSASSWLSK